MKCCVEHCNYEPTELVEAADSKYIVCEPHLPDVLADVAIGKTDHLLVVKE